MTDRNFSVISAINCMGLDNTQWDIDCFSEETSSTEYFQTEENVTLTPGEYIIIYSVDGANDDLLLSAMTKPDFAVHRSVREKLFLYKMD